MTIRTNARVAGITFLVYIAAGISTMAHAWPVPVGTVLTLIQQFSALVLAVTLYAITRDVDADVAMFGLVCRVAEGILGATSDSMARTAIFFAVGSTAYSWLLLRGRLIPVGLAWLGVFASLLLVVCLPLQLGGVLPRVVAQAMWLPMLAFEVPLGIWLIVKGTTAITNAHGNSFSTQRTQRTS